MKNVAHALDNTFDVEEVMGEQSVNDDVCHPSCDALIHSSIPQVTRIISGFLFSHTDLS